MDDIEGDCDGNQQVYIKKMYKYKNKTGVIIKYE